MWPPGQRPMMAGSEDEEDVDRSWPRTFLRGLFFVSGFVLTPHIGDDSICGCATFFSVVLVMVLQSGAPVDGPDGGHEKKKKKNRTKQKPQKRRVREKEGSIGMIFL